MSIKPRKPSRRPAARPPAPAARRERALPEPSPRHDGWTRERQTGFLQALAESACVEEACAVVGMSRQSAYRLRARVDAQGFRIAWDKALDYGIRRLSDACLSRALNGEARPVFYQGEQIGERRHYDNRLAMFLLRYRDPLRYAASLDQMVYSGHAEGAAIGLAKAIHRVDAEADGVWEPDETLVPEPFEIEPIRDARARQEMEAFIASDAPIYGSHERRTRLEEARHAHRLKQSGYKTHAEWQAAQNAERAAEEKATRDHFAFLDRGWGHGGVAGPAEADSRPDVVSPLSPSATADPPPAAAPDPEPPVAVRSEWPPGAGLRAKPKVRSLS